MNGDKEIFKYVDKINTINNCKLKIITIRSTVIIRIGDKGKDFTLTKMVTTILQSI